MHSGQSYVRISFTQEIAFALHLYSNSQINELQVTRNYTNHQSKPSNQPTKNQKPNQTPINTTEKINACGSPIVQLRINAWEQEKQGKQEKRGKAEDGLSPAGKDSESGNVLLFVWNTDPSLVLHHCRAGGPSGTVTQWDGQPDSVSVSVIDYWHNVDS